MTRRRRRRRGGRVNREKLSVVGAPRGRVYHVADVYCVSPTRPRPPSIRATDPHPVSNFMGFSICAVGSKGRTITTFMVSAWRSRDSDAMWRAPPPSPFNRQLYDALYDGLYDILYNVCILMMPAQSGTVDINQI